MNDFEPDYRNIVAAKISGKPLVELLEGDFRGE